MRTSTLSEDLNKNDHIAINVTKSKIMFVTSKHNHSIIPQDFPGISDKDSHISVSNSEKLLSVTIDNTLSWSTEVDSVINKCNTYLYCLSRIKSFLYVENRKLFYNAYI